MTGPQYTVSLKEARDPELCGRPAVVLARFLEANVAVPDGIVITTEAFRHGLLSVDRIPEPIQRALSDAYERFDGPVDIRPSPAGPLPEDPERAGRFETTLAVKQKAAFLAAVLKCWKSLEASRNQAGFRRAGISAHALKMAVIVQPSLITDASGVLSTANPDTGAEDEFLIQACWGVGDFSGLTKQVADRYLIDAETGDLKRRSVATKKHIFHPGRDKPDLVPNRQRRNPVLTEEPLRLVHELGRRVRASEGGNGTFAWALSNGVPHVIERTAGLDVEAIRLAREAREHIRETVWKALDDDQGPWVRFDAVESMDRISPLTWSLYRRLLSEQGAMGHILDKLGFEPSVDHAMDRFGSRVYLDLSRAAKWFARHGGSGFELEALAEDPDLARLPPEAGRPNLRGRIGGKKGRQAIEALTAHAEVVETYLTEHTLPEFASWLDKREKRDLAELVDRELVDFWRKCRSRVVDQFGREVLFCDVLQMAARRSLRSFCEDKLWAYDPDDLVNVLSSGGRADQGIHLLEGLHKVAGRQLSTEGWLAQYGHRAPGEMELSAPRWREIPEQIERMAEGVRGSMSPLMKQKVQIAKSERLLKKILSTLPGRFRRRLEEEAGRARRLAPLREDVRHAFLRGWALFRDLALEMGRRLNLGDEVFLLEEDELLEAMGKDQVPRSLLEERLAEREADRRVLMPKTISRYDVDSLGERIRPPRENRIQGQPLAPGRSNGAIAIVRSLEDTQGIAKGSVLVFRGGDVSYATLYLGASGLVFENGGELSQGAVMARHLGVPAVAVDGAVDALEEGEMVVVNGDEGTVLRHGAGSERGAALPTDRVPEVAAAPRPPPRSRWERILPFAGAAVAGLWVVVAYFVWTGTDGAWSRLSEAMDRWFLPAARVLTWLGFSAAVATVAAFVSCVIQKFATDNARVREALRRAADDPLASAAAWTRARLARLFPLAVLLGPLLALFLWFPARAQTMGGDRASPGEPVRVEALIDAGYGGTVRLVWDPALTLDSATPATQTPRDLKAALDSVRSMKTDLPDDVQNRFVDQLDLTGWTNSLDRFLSDPVRSCTVVWEVIAPEDRAGAFEVAVEAPGHPSVQTEVVVGGALLGHVPSGVTAPGEDHPVRRLQLVYPKAGGIRLGQWLWLPVFAGAYFLVAVLLRRALRLV